MSEEWRQMRRLGRMAGGCVFGSIFLCVALSLIGTALN